MPMPMRTNKKVQKLPTMPLTAVSPLQANKPQPISLLREPVSAMRPSGRPAMA
ncbi:Uncharacterised protein [Mycobacterium tuberculosis]|nr:Uncharacterised protein [Mycobacterium tuberculosis]